MPKWDKFDFKNNIHEPMQGMVYHQMHSPFPPEVTKNIYAKLRGPLSMALFINLQVQLEALRPHIPMFPQRQRRTA